MHLSFSTTVCPDALLPEATQMAADAGFDRIELFRTWTQSSPVHPDWSVPMVRDQIKERALTLSGLNIRNISGLRSTDKERDLNYNLRQVDWDIQLAQALGLSSANTKGGARTDEAMADLIEGVNRTLDRVEDFTLNLGNHSGNRLEGIDDYRAVLPNVSERARVLADTGHLLSAGVDVMAFVEAFADRIGLVHLRDQQGATPVPFGKGDLPIKELVGALKGAGYDGILVVELERVDWADPLDAAREARDCVLGLL